MKKLFLIIGAPGSGKTTDAQIIKENNEDIEHFSTGELLRAEVESNSQNGQVINSFISKGELVPLEIVIMTIINAIKTSLKDIVLIDGYPRSVEQMRELDRVLASQKDIVLKSVIEVEVSDEVAKQRVLWRGRSDDDESVFYNRLRVYSEPLAEIRAFYGDLLHKINGEREIKSIVDEMEAFIKSKI